MSSQNNQTVQRTIVVPVSRERAFTFFTARMLEWWPREFTFAEDDLAEIVMEPGNNGSWFERDAQGKVTVWGSVQNWDAPHAVVLTWRISPQRTPEPDDASASEIEVRFIAEDATTTRVELEQRHFERHGEGFDMLRAGMDSPEGWTKILERYSELILDPQEQMF